MRLNQSILAISVTFWIAMVASSANAEAKIGVSNPQRAILQSEIGKQGVQQINSQFTEQEDLLKEMGKEVTTLLEKLKKDTELMSEQEFGELYQEISVKRARLSQGVQEIQRLKTEQSQRLIQSLSPRYEEAIEALVLSDKYDLILPQESVHYRHELYDVTAKITEKMNALEK